MKSTNTDPSSLKAHILVWVSKFEATVSQVTLNNASDALSDLDGFASLVGQAQQNLQETEARRFWNEETLDAASEAVTALDDLEQEIVNTRQQLEDMLDEDEDTVLSFMENEAIPTLEGSVECFAGMA